VPPCSREAALRCRGCRKEGKPLVELGESDLPSIVLTVIATDPAGADQPRAAPIYPYRF